MVWQAMLAKVAGSAIGKVIGKVVDYIPGKSESRRNKIDRLEKEQDELKKRPSSSKRDSRLAYIADELSKLIKASINE